MIRVHALSKRYGEVRAVDGVSFQVDAGEVVGFLGPNGAGKSTTMRILCGYLAADAGEVEVDGKAMHPDASATKRALGYLPESNPLYERMRVGDLLDFVGRAAGLGGAARRDAVARELARCGLEGWSRRPIRTLSKGYRQRVGLAQALLADPPALVLDEPTNGLDPTEVARMRDLIGELGRTKTILLSTHVLSEVQALCRRVVILSRGRVVADGSPLDLAAAEREELRVTLRARGPRGGRGRGALSGPGGRRRAAAGGRGRACRVRADRQRAPADRGARGRPGARARMDVDRARARAAHARARVPASHRGHARGWGRGTGASPCRGGSPMSGTWTLLRRELLVALGAPVTWLACALVVLGLHAAFFFVGHPVGDMRLPSLWQGGTAALDTLFAWVPLVLCIVAPAVTMASWAEERRAGTDELLLTQPVSLRQTVLAKFLSAWVQLGCVLSIAILPAAVVVGALGPLDHGTAGGGLLGAWALAAPCAAIGCLASACARDQLAAFLVAAVVLLLLWSVGLFVRVLPADLAEVTWAASPALSYLETGARGLVDARDLVHQGLFTAAALVLNVVVVEGWRWR